jgi:cytochrome c oxidase assembly protein subunit 15
MNDNPDCAIGVWLLFVAFLIYLMIGLGGYTRLSDSGLSMVKWKPVTGWLPPLSEEKWQQEFKDYQHSPQYQKVNYEMDLIGFKKIYYPEYLHRVFGRLIGLAFFIPFFYFVWRKKLRGGKMWHYLFIGLLGGLQGGIGWFMVKSGLSDDPQVSAYRLALHLCLAGFILWMCFLNGMREFFKLPKGQTLGYKGLLALVAVQICSGAFVSGQKAGVAFKAAMSFKPEVLWLPELGFKNLTENLATVMLTHVGLGLLIFVLVLISAIKALLQSGQKLPLTLLALAITAQVALGMITATNYNPRPIGLSLTHQLFAFVVLLILSCSALICQKQTTKP